MNPTRPCKIVPHSDIQRGGTTSEEPCNAYKNRDTYLGTWNARNLYSGEALEILNHELDRSPLDIVALQEVRWPGEVNQKFRNVTLFYGGSETVHLGTGFLFHNKIPSAIKDQVC